MKLSVGQPPIDGRYVVYAPCKALQVREWCEPRIATWAKGRWHHGEAVWGWVGPLPVVHGNDCLALLEDAPMREYDL